MIFLFAAPGARLATAAAASLLLSAPLLAQSAAETQAVAPVPQESAGDVPANPHEMLGELTGGPDGSPTALRGNPLPGTSTSIPTTNPAPVVPLAERQGQPVDRERTGIEGQCDPVVGLGNCPEPSQVRPGLRDADALAPAPAAVEEGDPAASVAADGSATLED